MMINATGHFFNRTVNIFVVPVGCTKLVPGGNSTTTMAMTVISSPPYKSNILWGHTHIMTNTTIIILVRTLVSCFLDGGTDFVVLFEVVVVVRRSAVIRSLTNNRHFDQGLLPGGSYS